MLFPVPDINITRIPDPEANSRGITWEVARLDLLHPVISGNKLFKLHEFLVQARQLGKQQITTFGGAYSNHLVATAYACHISGIRSKGIIRGEQPHSLSHTLQDCLNYGMDLHFISREQFRKETSLHQTNTEYQPAPDEQVVPEGGFHPYGALGAMRIMDNLSGIPATHLLLATGTATTLAGILLGSSGKQEVIGIPVLKNMQDIKDRLSFLEVPESKNPVIFDQYHFGGYAKYTDSLLTYMNDLFLAYQLPTDFVYTAKMMYATRDLIMTGYFPEGSHVLCIHTGGLQGNKSLPKGSLIF